MNKVCHVCDSEMELKTINRCFNFKGKTVILKNIQAYVCKNCNEIVFSDEQLEQIENILESR